MKTAEKINVLRHFPLFESLTEEEMILLSEMTEIKKVKKHKYIYKADEDSDSLYFLLKGTIKIGAFSPDGREVIKTILHPKAMFGELSIMGEASRSNFAITMENDVEYLVLSVSKFKELMQKNFDLNLHVINLLGKKLYHAERRLESLVFQDARTRIVEFIKDNARDFGMKVGFEMLLKHSLTQQDIANFTGTSRQTVTSVLNDLRKSNQIYFKRKSILIRDMASLS